MPNGRGSRASERPDSPRGWVDPNRRRQRLATGPKVLGLLAIAQPGIEKTPQVPRLMELAALLSNRTERAGFEPAVPARGTPVFETGSISHSDTSPCLGRPERAGRGRAAILQGPGRIGKESQ